MFKKMMRRFMDEFEGQSSAGGSGGSDFNMEGALSTIGSDLFGSGNDDTGTDVDAGESDAGGNATGDAVSAGGGDKAGTPAGDAATAAPGEGGAAAPAKLEAPNTWRPEAKAEWDKLSPVAQQEVLKREADIFTGLEAYKADATVGKTFSQVIAPYQQLFSASGADPVVLTQNLMHAHYSLATGTPEQKLAKIVEIAGLYGVELPSGRGADGDEAPYVDPTVKALQDKLNAVESRLSETATAQAQARNQEMQQIRNYQEMQQIRNSLASEIEAFAADPANIYFADVADDITALFKAGQAKDLKEAYGKAVWLNPVTREKEIARTTAAKAEETRKAAEDKAKAARSAAAANVRTSAKQASGTTLLGSIDDTLKETLANINARTK